MNRLAMTLAFAALLTGCHSTRPVTQDINQPAGLGTTLPYPVLDWKVLTTVADRGQITMSTLFGNDAAVAAARSDQSYPAGSVVALVTWHGRDNPNWFGSRVPGDPQQVEFVEFTADGPRYRSFAAPGFQEQSGDAADRIAAITAMKAVPLP